MNSAKIKLWIMIGVGVLAVAGGSLFLFKDSTELFKGSSREAAVSERYPARVNLSNSSPNGGELPLNEYKTVALFSVVPPTDTYYLKEFIVHYNGGETSGAHVKPGLPRNNISFRAYHVLRGEETLLSPFDIHPDGSDAMRFQFLEPVSSSGGITIKIMASISGDAAEISEHKFGISFHGSNDFDWDPSLSTSTGSGKFPLATEIFSVKKFVPATVEVMEGSAAPTQSGDGAASEIAAPGRTAAERRSEPSQIATIFGAPSGSDSDASQLVESLAPLREEERQVVQIIPPDVSSLIESLAPLQPETAATAGTGHVVNTNDGRARAPTITFALSRATPEAATSEFSDFTFVTGVDVSSSEDAEISALTIAAKRTGASSEAVAFKDIELQLRTSTPQFTSRTLSLNTQGKNEFRFDRPLRVRKNQTTQLAIFAKVKGTAARNKKFALGITEENLKSLPVAQLRGLPVLGAVMTVDSASSGVQGFVDLSDVRPPAGAPDDDEETPLPALPHGLSGAGQLPSFSDTLEDAREQQDIQDQVIDALPARITMSLATEANGSVAPFTPEGRQSRALSDEFFTAAIIDFRTNKNVDVRSVTISQETAGPLFVPAREIAVKLFTSSQPGQENEFAGLEPQLMNENGKVTFSFAEDARWSLSSGRTQKLIIKAKINSAPAAGKTFALGISDAGDVQTASGATKSGAPVFGSEFSVDTTPPPPPPPADTIRPPPTQTTQTPPPAAAQPPPATVIQDATARASAEEKPKKKKKRAAAALSCESLGRFTYTGPEAEGRTAGMCIDCATEQYIENGGQCATARAAASTNDVYQSAGNASLRGSQRLVRAPERGNTGPGLIPYTAAILVAAAVGFVHKKRK